MTGYWTLPTNRSAAEVEGLTPRDGASFRPSRRQNSQRTSGLPPRRALGCGRPDSLGSKGELSLTQRLGVRWSRHLVMRERMHEPLLALPLFLRVYRLTWKRPWKSPHRRPDK